QPQHRGGQRRSLPLGGQPVRQPEQHQIAAVVLHVASTMARSRGSTANLAGGARPEDLVLPWTGGSKSILCGTRAPLFPTITYSPSGASPPGRRMRRWAWSSGGRSGRSIVSVFDAFLRQDASLVQDVEQGETRYHDDRGQRDREQDGRQGAGG